MIMVTGCGLSLERFLRCPACGRQASMGSPELYLGGLTCKRCSAHWWATRLAAGAVRTQLLVQFEDAEVVNQLMTLFGLPEAIREPQFWQILLTGQQWHRYNQDTSSGLGGRSIALLRGVVSILRRAS